MSLPKPYFENDRATLYHGDCLEILPHLSGVDAVVADPPYGIGYRPDYGNRRLPNGGWMRRTESPAVIGDDVDFDPSPLLEYPCVLWGGDHYATRLPSTGRWLIWDKRCGVIPERCQSDCEVAWCSNSGPRRIFRHIWDGMVKDSERGQQRAHPTQKPIEVMKWCLEFVDGDCILDPFMGSGTTGVACMKLGRRFIGIEIEEKYCAIAARRIAEASEWDALLRSAQ